ncbi:L-threonine dehydratase catabolic TdcB-like [Clavelina lepadiformis]|uniref:L-threonine dehydratase catabolic TdcB-like n=1 Tax=Clavelina lepadiformis TaxID=159417 RepID=UPI0040415516
MERTINIQDIHSSIKQAYHRIKPYVYHTPLVHSLPFSNNTKVNVYLKLESEQKTGSFKVRGSFNKLLGETSDLKHEYVTASTGNHGMACALALSTLGKKGVVFVPITVNPAKESSLREYGIELRKYGDDCVKTEREARQYAVANGMAYISPYADMQIIYGQGTIAEELAQDLSHIDAVFVTVGGGGLISGIGSYFKVFSKETEIVGCLPENSPVMMESVKSGQIIEMVSLETLSDASAGGIEQGSPTVPICQVVVDRWVTVSEEEIANAMLLVLEKHHKVVEGAAGVALASFLKCTKEYEGKNVVIVLCGSNLSMDNLKFVISKSK